MIRGLHLGVFSYNVDVDTLMASVLLSFFFSLGVWGGTARASYHMHATCCSGSLTGSSPTRRVSPFAGKRWPRRLCRLGACSSPREQPCRSATQGGRHITRKSTRRPTGMPEPSWKKTSVSTSECSCNGKTFDAVCTRSSTRRCLLCLFFCFPMLASCSSHPLRKPR